MDNSKKRGWLGLALIGLVAIVIVIVWPNKDYEQKGNVSILADSVVAIAPTEKRWEENKKPATWVKREERKDTTRQQPMDYKEKKRYYEQRPSKYDNFKVALNGSDTNDWKELKGIGSAYARRIVNYRKSLGGYHSKTQLKEVYGMNEELYEMIEPHLIENSDEITPMNLNSVELDKLKRHPYIDYYQAKAIVNYREKIGKFTKVEDVLNISLIDTATFNKIKEYITI